MWKGSFRVADCAISPDGRRLVAIDTESNVHVFDFHTYEEDYCLSLPCKATSVTISRDSKHMLVNLSQGEIQLIDLESTTVVRRFRGQKQGEFVIRSTFGGAGENFVVSGSEGEFYKQNYRLCSAVLIMDRLSSLHLAQREWLPGRDPGGPCCGMREFHSLESQRPGNVRVGGR